MKEIPTDDRLYGKGIIRADGRKIHDMYLFEVKSPAESRYFGDFYKLRATIPAAEAFRPLKDGGCPLGACPNSDCSILSDSDSSLGHEQVFSPLE